MIDGADLAFVVKAVDFAARKHRDHRRKDKDASPYINHPLALMQVLSGECGVRDPVILAAAALHDTIEDTQTTREELEAAFGRRVADLVVELTDDKTIEKSRRKVCRLSTRHKQAQMRPF